MARWVQVATAKPEFDPQEKTNSHNFALQLSHMHFSALMLALMPSPPRLVLPHKRHKYVMKITTQN